MPQRLLQAARLLLSAPKQSGAIPRKIEVLDSVYNATDPVSYLAKLLASTETQSSIYIYTPQPEDHYIAGVDLEKNGDTLPTTGVWYWPADNRRFDTHKPRYKNLEDAVIASLKEHPSTGASVGAYMPDRTGHNEWFGSVQIRSWFDDPDFVAPGATEKWWVALVAKLKTASPPVPWGGSDESMAL